MRATFPNGGWPHSNDFNDFEVTAGEPAIFLNTGKWLTEPFTVVTVSRETPPSEPKNKGDPFTDRLRYPDLVPI